MSELDRALTLLILCGRAISNRRQHERAAGYPEEYGEDKDILVSVKGFLREHAARTAELIALMESIH